MFIVESDFKYKGYRCLTTFTSLGFRCGYVGIPIENYFYGKKYTDYTNLDREVIDDEPVGKRGIFTVVVDALDNNSKVRMDILFDVHGSLTFAGDNHPEKCGLWWLGFDCGHAGDGHDLDKIEELWGDIDYIRERVAIDRKYYIYDPIRSLEYVQQECRNLADQIIKYEEVAARFHRENR